MLVHFQKTFLLSLEIYMQTIHFSKLGKDGQPPSQRKEENESNKSYEILTNLKWEAPTPKYLQVCKIMSFRI